jgi:hypothetical protein
MAFTEALRLLIDADTRGAVRGIEAVGTATDKSLGKSQKTIDKWSKGLTTAGVGLVAFGAAGLFGLGKAAAASEEANLSVVKLQNSLANNPRLAGENVKSFTDLADAIQSKTAADADAIVEGAALLGTFKLTGDEIRSLLPVVTDYARKFGVSIPDAAVQVGKALDGQIGALKRNGVSIDEVLFKTDRYAAVTQALREQVGGFAEAEGKTFAGSVERMKNQLGDLAEGVGGGAVDAFSTLFGAVDKGTDALNRLSPGAQNAIGKFATFGSVAVLVAGGLSFTIGQVLTAKQRFADAADAARALTGRLGGLKVMAGLTAGAAGLAGLVIALKSLDDAAEAKQLDDFFKKLRQGADESDKSIRRMVAGAIHFDRLDDLLEDAAEQSPVLAERLIDVAEAMGLSEGEVGKLRDRLAELESAEAQTADAEAAHAEQLQGTADAASEAADALQTYSDNLRSTFDPIFNVVSAQEGLNEAIAAQAAVYKDAESSAADKAAADQRVREAVVELDGAAANLNQQIANGSVKVADARERFITMATQMGVSRGEAVRLADQMVKTTDKVRTLGNTDPTVTITAQDLASLTISQVRERLRQLKDKSIILTVTHREIFESQRRGGTTGGPQLRQHGGPVKAGDPYIVGERGPELFVPANHGMIVPGSHGGGAVGGPVTVDITLNVTGNGRLAREIHEEVRAGRIQLSANGARVQVGP